jgi:hypothetical protein
MKAKITAIAGMLALSLVSSAVSAPRPSNVYLDSENGTVSSGVIKKCVDGTLEKNINPFISGGNPEDFPIEWREFFDVEGSQVELVVVWNLDNSFNVGFGPNGDALGTIIELGAENNTEKVKWKYNPPAFSADPYADRFIGPFADTGLNVVDGEETAPKVNSIDICMGLLDIDPPTIVFEKPTNGEQVSGEYPVKVLVSDPSGVDTNTVAFNVDGQFVDYMNCTGSAPDYVCQYSWNTEEYDTGFYELTATATDLVGNQGTGPDPAIEVEVVRQYTQCFGTIGGEDFDDPSAENDPNDPAFTGLAGGCAPTDAVLVQTPPNGTFCSGPDADPTKCFIAGTLLKPANPTDRCGVYGFDDYRVLIGDDYPSSGIRLHVFDGPPAPGLDPSQVPGVVAAIKAAYPAGTVFPLDAQLLRDAVVLDENTYCANGCCLIAQHTKGALLDELYQNWDSENGTVFIKVHKTREKFAEDGKADVVTTCYNDSNLQKSFNAGYQPLFQTDDDTGLLTVLTQECNSPARTLSRGNGFDVANAIVNTIEIPDDATPEEWLDFRVQKILEDFDRVFDLFSIIDRDGYVLAGNFNRFVKNPVSEAQRKVGSNNPDSKDQARAALAEAADGLRTKITCRITEANPCGEALALIEHLQYELRITADEQRTIAGIP